MTLLQRRRKKQSVDCFLEEEGREIPSHLVEAEDWAVWANNHTANIKVLPILLPFQRLLMHSLHLHLHQMLVIYLPLNAEE